MSLPLRTTSSEPYQNLIDSAQASCEQGHFREAVILAQTALELFTEKMLGHLYHTRGLDYLKPQFENLLINYNIGNSKVSGLYIALSGDEIKQTPFWAALIDHVALRNDMVHDGQNATAEQAKASLAAVQATMNHIKEFNSPLSS